jgi:hypothetical protein
LTLDDLEPVEPRREPAFFQTGEELSKGLQHALTTTKKARTRKQRGERMKRQSVAGRPLGEATPLDELRMMRENLREMRGEKPIQIPD